jgi:hypothetical protein
MHWFIYVEQSSPVYGSLYGRFQDDFLQFLQNIPSSRFHDMLTRQHEFCEQLHELAAALKNKTYKAQRERLLHLLSENGTFHGLRQLTEVSFFFFLDHS